MIINICVGIISIAFVILVIVLVIALRKVIDTLKHSKRMIADADQLIKTTNDLVLDIKDKSEALNIFFHPFAKTNKKKADPQHLKFEKIADVINFAADSVVLFNKLRKKH